MRFEFHILARAVILVDRHVLLARATGAAHTFLPGGHVRPGEPIAATLARELLEELGVVARVGAYVGALEASWEAEAVRHHEINHLFVVQAPGLTPDRPPPSMEPQLEFLWSSLDDLDRHTLLPAPVCDRLRRWSLGDRSTWWVGL